MHSDQSEANVPGPLSRREVVLAGGAAVGTSMAGCLGGGGGSGEVPEAIALSNRQQCDVCGMIIEDHPGPNGQIFYEDHSPDGHDNPAWFDALKACMFPYYFDHQRFDWKVAAMYATDYSNVDYEIVEEGDQPYISSFTSAESFADATKLYYVVGSEVQGAMGPAFIPFSTESDATSFGEEWGGKVVPFDDVDISLLEG